MYLFGMVIWHILLKSYIKIIVVLFNICRVKIIWTWALSYFLHWVESSIRWWRIILFSKYNKEITSFYSGMCSARLPFFSCWRCVFFFNFWKNVGLVYFNFILSWTLYYFKIFSVFTFVLLSLSRWCLWRWPGFFFL